MARKKRRCAPYYAVNSPAERAHNAIQECRMARKGASELVRGSNASAYKLNRMASIDTRDGQAIARILINIGHESAGRYERKRRQIKASEVPAVNTSYGKHVEWMLVPSKREQAISMLLQMAIKSGNVGAVELISRGKIKAGMAVMARSVG